MMIEHKLHPLTKLDLTNFVALGRFWITRWTFKQGYFTSKLLLALGR